MQRKVRAVLMSIAVAVTASLAACERAPAVREPVILSIGGDSIIPMVRDTLRGGSGTAVCTVVLQATVEGPEGEHVMIRDGGVQYYWWQTGVPISRDEWAAGSTDVFGADSTMMVGETRVAGSHDFTQPEPALPVRAEVRFNYGMSTQPDEHETDTFRFYCY